jgi:5-methyltetrahydropteroyltriglutamate--homocysteine methyltransferase
MVWNDRHPVQPDASFDGGALDCGNGLLLLIRRHMDPLNSGQLLEIRSTEPSVDEELPAWCRMTGNALLSRVRLGTGRSYLVQKGGIPRPSVAGPSPTARSAPAATSIPVYKPLPPFAVMGIGSWPRPGWLLNALHEKLCSRLPENVFQQYADDAVRLAISAQERAGVDVVTDGEQRRDNYASFVASRLDNCQLIPITDLLPYVDDPDKFADELKALDVPAEQVRHPAVFGKLSRSKSITAPELERARSLTPKPVKIALPGPYLLTRTMWLDCISDKAYSQREELAKDIIAALRQEIGELLEGGAAIVQLDEPVLTEVVFGRKNAGRSFMCGALGEKGDPDSELNFAGNLIREVLAGWPRDQMAIHVCRGNWSRDESVALSGPYTPLVPLLKTLPVGIYFLEMATPRAGELKPLRELPQESRIGIGVVNQKLDSVESPEQIIAKAKGAIREFGADRVLLNPDCGFATFADNPLASAETAEAKLASIAKAARTLRANYFGG